MLWDLNESKHLYSLTAGDEIHALVFSPNRYWLCAATSSSIIIFDLEKKSKVDELKPEYTQVGKKSREPECVSLAWSADGQTLFAGYTDNLIRAWGVMSDRKEMAYKLLTENAYRSLLFQRSEFVAHRVR